MSEKTYPMTIEEKRKIGERIRRTQIGSVVRKLLSVSRLRVPMVTFIQIVNTKLLRMNRPLLRDRFLVLKQKSVMQKSSIAMP